jgi:excisionase family DNA binding protein
MDEMLTVAEVAAYLKVSQPTIRRWCARKKLPAFRIGREWRIDKKELDRVIQRLSLDVDDEVVEECQDEPRAGP